MLQPRGQAAGSSSAGIALPDYSITKFVLCH